MSDPLRTETSRPSEPASRAERDAKIEQLLLAGLDDYFAGQYDQAVDVWTRALFLDRSHARARAYIERARSALAEQQRESEELLHSGVAAFNRGESGEARRLLHAAIDRGAPSLRARRQSPRRLAPAPSSASPSECLRSSVGPPGPTGSIGARSSHWPRVRRGATRPSLAMRPRLPATHRCRCLAAARTRSRARERWPRQGTFATRCRLSRWCVRPTTSGQ